MDGVASFAMKNKMKGMVGGDGGGGSGQPAPSMSISDVLPTGGRTDLDIFEPNFPPLLKVWYVEKTVLGEQAQFGISLWSIVVWIVLTALVPGAWLELLLAIFFALLYFLLFSWNCERSFFAMWQHDSDAYRAALGLQGTVIVNIFINFLLGWGHFNGWLRYINIGDSNPNAVIFWEVATALTATGWTLLLGLSLYTMYRFRACWKDPPARPGRGTTTIPSAAV